MTREMPIENGTLKSNLDAANKRIENLAEPVNPNDAVTKRYLEEHGGGKPITLDDDVTETSENGVKSKGIWSFVKGLFNKLSAVATSGSYNDLTDKPKLPTVIELDEATKKLYVMKDGVRTTEEITSWATLFNLAKRGLVRLYYLASGSGDSGRKALYTAHMVDDKIGSTPAILFDATGFIGANTIYSRTITLTKESTDSIHVAVGNLTEVAKKSDVPAVVAPASDMAFSSDENKDKVPTCGSVGAALGRHIDGSIKFIDNGDGIAIEVTDSTGGVRHLYLPTSATTDWPFVALVSQLSGITAQDITDFLKYDPTALVVDDARLQHDVTAGTLLCNKNSSWWFFVKNDALKGEDIAFIDYTDYIPTEGFQKLLSLFGSDNEYLKAALFTDTAFKTKVEEIIDEHGGGGGDMTFVLKYNPEDEGYIYFDDGQPETTNA